MQTAIGKVIGYAERVLTAICAFLMGILSLIVCWQVFARYVLQKSPVWVEEFSVTALMWIGLLGAAAAVWTGDHMRLELLTKRLPKNGGLVLEVLIDAAIGYFSLFLFKQGMNLTSATWTSQMSTIPLPIGITYLVLPVSAVIMVIFAALRIVSKILEIKSPTEKKGGK